MSRYYDHLIAVLEDAIPPHNFEAEMGLLGLLLTNNQLYGRISALVRAEDFADPDHGHIFEACSELISTGQRADPITLRKYFETSGALADVGGVDYLAKLAGSVITNLAAPHYAKAIREAAIMRRTINQCGETIQKITSGEYGSAANAVGELSREATALISEIPHEGLRRSDVLASLSKWVNEDLPCTPTCFESLNRCLGGGLYPGRAYALMGRLKSYKTMMAGQLSKAWNDDGVKHLFICGEMSAREIEERHVARELERNSMAFLSKKTRSDPAFRRAVEEYRQSTKDFILYENAAGIHFERLKSLVYSAVYTHGCRGFILDYLQLVRGSKRGQSRVEFLDEFTQWIADTVRQLDIWALVLGQINQEGKARWGEGVTMAFDQVYALRECDGIPNGRWLEMWETRYTPHINIGGPKDPAFELNGVVGPYLYEPDKIAPGDKGQTTMYDMKDFG